LLWLIDKAKNVIVEHRTCVEKLITVGQQSSPCLAQSQSNPLKSLLFLIPFSRENHRLTNTISSTDPLHSEQGIASVFVCRVISSFLLFYLHNDTQGQMPAFFGLSRIVVVNKNQEPQKGIFLRVNESE
jgi:hypothetical protein